MLHITALLQAPSAERLAVLNLRIRIFAAATITYNLIEAVVALWTGTEAHSAALIGFGLDSVIEVTSALALSWQFSAKDPERREHPTLRTIAISFFALSAFVSLDAVLGAAPGRTGTRVPQLPWLIPNKPCCAPIFLRCCWPGWS